MNKREFLKLFGAAACLTSVPAFAQSTEKVALVDLAQAVADRHKWPVYIHPKVMDYKVDKIQFDFRRVDLDMWKLLETYHPNPLKKTSKAPLHVIVDAEDEKIVIKPLKRGRSRFEMVEKVRL